MNNNTILSRTFHFAKTFSGIPNAPFLHGPLLNKILSCLSDMGLTEKTKSSDFSRGGYALDDFCLYVHFKRGKAAQPLLIDSHLDHPAFVLDGKGCGLAFGSVGLDRIKNLLKSGPLELRIFDPAGEFLTLGQLTNLQLFTAQIETPTPIPGNSYGLWNVTDFEINDDKVFMHSADNMIMTNVMFALIEQIASSPEKFPDLDITFVFTFLEEVFEVSASALAMKRHTPFGQIDHNWIIIVLECMQAVPLANQDHLVSSQSLMEQDLRSLRLTDDDKAYSPRLRKAASNTKNTHQLYQAFDLPLPNHEAGVVIKINDTDTVYGYEFQSQPNLAESLLLTTADKLGVAYQHTLSGGACNGTAYSLFPTSSHIATLSVPNPYKHNIYFDGSVVPEEVKVTDIKSVAKVMLLILESAGQEISQHPKAISQQLKNTSLVPGGPVARRLRAERSTIAWSARSRLSRSCYFGKNPTEKLIFNLRGGLARIRELALQRVPL